MTAMEKQTIGCPRIHSPCDPFAELQITADKGPAAAQSLLAWLFDHSVVRTLPPQLREDIVHNVAETLLGKASAILHRIQEANPGAGSADLAGKVKAYVGSMLKNEARTRYRGSVREVSLDELEYVERTDPDLRLELRETLDVLHVAMRQVSRSSGSSQNVVRELEALAAGEVTMEDLIRAELEEDALPGTPTWYRARDRIYKRHGRIRTAILRELARMRAHGKLREDMEHRAGEAVHQLLRARAT